MTEQRRLFADDLPRDPGRLLWHGRPRRERAGTPRDARRFAERVAAVLDFYDPKQPKRARA